MKEFQRRTIEELVARYALEPELHDLYVEGPGDKLFFEWFLTCSACKPVAVFEIDTVDISPTILEELKLKPRNRDRVIALSIQLEQFLECDANSPRCLRCIADSDFDFVLGRKHTSKYLLYTDYASLDLYFFDVSALEKLLKLGVRRQPHPAKAIQTNIGEVLKDVFLIRAANEYLGWYLEWVPFVKCCRLKDYLIDFDCQRFVENYLTRNGRRRDIEAFENTVEHLRAVKVKSIRHCIRGHDLFELLAWYVSKITKKSSNKFRDPLVVRSMLCCTSDVMALLKERLFTRLHQIYK